MSGDNVALLTEFWRVWKQEGGTGVVRRYDEFFTEDAEWCPPMRELTGAHYIGCEGLGRYVHDLAQVLDGLEGELEELVEVAPDVVRSKVRMRASGKVSGVAIDALMIGISRFREGRMSLAWASYDPVAASKAEAAIVNGEPVPI